MVHRNPRPKPHKRKTWIGLPWRVRYHKDERFRYVQCPICTKKEFESGLFMCHSCGRKVCEECLLEAFCVECVKKTKR